MTSPVLRDILQNQIIVEVCEAVAVEEVDVEVRSVESVEGQRAGHMLLLHRQQQRLCRHHHTIHWQNQMPVQISKNKNMGKHSYYADHPK